MNLVMVLVILVLMPFVNYAMHPDTDHTIAVDPALLVDEAEKTYTMNTPAEKIERNKGPVVYHFLCWALRTSCITLCRRGSTWI